MSLQTKDTKKAKALQREKDEDLGQDRARVLLGLKRQRRGAPMSLQAFNDKYFAYHENAGEKTANTVRAERSHLRIVMRALAPHTMLDAITDERARAYKVSRVQTIRPMTWNSHLATLKSIWETGIRWGCLVANPFRHLARQAKEEPLKKRIDRKGLVKVLKKATRFWQLVILFLYGIDCRCGELCRLRRTDVHRNEGYLEFLLTKEGRIKRVALTPDLKAIIEEAETLSRSEYVFSIDRLGPGPLTVDYVSKVLRGLGQACLVAFSPHRLRHTGPSDLLDRGADLVTLQTILGHAKITTTRGYAHPDYEAQRRVLSLLPIGKLNRSLQRRDSMGLQVRRTLRKGRRLAV